MVFFQGDTVAIICMQQKRECKSLDFEFKKKMVASVDPKRGICVLSCGGHGFRTAQCPEVV